MKIFTVLKYFLSFRTFEKLVVCPEKQSVPWIHCIEYIFESFRILNNLRMPSKIKFALKFFTALKYFYLSGFLRNSRLPWKQSLSWNFSLYVIYFIHSGCLSNLCLPWKREHVLQLTASLWTTEASTSERWEFEALTNRKATSSNRSPSLSSLYYY